MKLPSSENQPILHAFAPPPMLVAQLTLAASMALFLAISLVVLLGKTQDFDQFVLIFLRDAADLSRPIGPDWVPQLIQTFTTLGNGLTLIAIVLLGVAWFVFRGDWLSMQSLLLVGVGGFVIDLGLKLGVGRPRPSVVPLLSVVDSWSYPSGHSMMTLAIFLALAVLIGRHLTRKGLRTTMIIAAVTLSLIVGFSRMYLGVHYPSDVAAGWTAGLAWISASWLVERNTILRRRRRSEKKKVAAKKGE
ncbi:MAG: phosphatase PAP2 family protein [Bacteroidota bacterium]|jgi:undecaprenyl-diphosphatase